jgi:hypothetical protein
MEKSFSPVNVNTKAHRRVQAKRNKERWEITKDIDPSNGESDAIAFDSRGRTI